MLCVCYKRGKVFEGFVEKVSLVTVRVRLVELTKETCIDLRRRVYGVKLRGVVVADPHDTSGTYTQEGVTLCFFFICR